MKRKLLCLLIAAALLIGVLPAAAAEAEENSQSPDAIVYIPLDNRPFNKDRVEQMAASLDLQLVMPKEDLYATKLDGQEKNANGTQYGDRGALLAWLMDEAEHYDTFLISLDQLLSGGLMNSRCMLEMENVVLPDGTEMSEYDVIDYLQELAATKTIYIIDSIPRLASSSGYGGYTTGSYNYTRNYGAMARPILQYGQLTVENIIANYRNTAQQPGPEVAELIDRYLTVRERKLRLCDYAMRHLSGQGNVQYILGVDDSSDGNNIQTNEIAYVRRFLGDDTLIFSALDGLAQMALAKIYMDRAGMQGLQASVDYFGCDSDMVPTFNYKSVGAMIEQTVGYFGGEILPEDAEETADVSILVAASTEDSTANLAAFQALIRRLTENEAAERPTILLDFTEKDRSVFHGLLTEYAHLGYLLSYSGYYENPVQVPMAVSQGLARYTALHTELSEQAQTAHGEGLLTALVKEFYRSDGPLTAMSGILSGEGLATNNFGGISQQKLRALQWQLLIRMEDATKDLMENFSRSNMIVSLEPFAQRGLSQAQLKDCWYPWRRTLEIGTSVSCQLSEQCHDIPVHTPYIQGVDSEHFKPNGNLTREQAAKLLVAVSNTEVLEPWECPFSDVAGWARGYVASAYAAGYMKGYPGGLFKGSGSITRAEFAAMLAQYADAVGMELERTETVSFTDVPDSGGPWYAQSVRRLAQAGVIHGYGDGSFRPQKNVTRAEAVVMLNRFFGRNDTPPAWMTAENFFTDVPETFWAYSAIAEASCLHFG